MTTWPRNESGGSKPVAINCYTVLWLPYKGVVVNLGAASQPLHRWTGGGAALKDAVLVIKAMTRNRDAKDRTDGGPADMSRGDKNPYSFPTRKASITPKIL
ncbi:hypothetical protein ACJZ2D_007712 [Fusarium nematophilum]